MNTGHQLIIQALKNVQTNTEKIAALMFIGKQLSQQMNLNEEEKTTIFQLINDNDNFLLESLKKYSNDNEQEYEFSIYISAYFFEEIVKHSNDKCEFVRIFCKILLSKSNEEETMKPTKIQPKVMETIFDCLDYVVSSENLSFFDEQFLFDLFFENLILKCYSIENQWEYRISNIIIKLINNSKCKENAEKFMEKICKFFVNDKSMKKFHLCRLIGFIIRNGPWNNDGHQKIIDTQWIQIIRDELFILFQNRLTNELRNLIIEFSSELTMKCKGFDWIKLKRWESSNSKFFRLLLKLITIELEIIWTQTTNRPLSGDKIVEHYTRCLMIFEYILFTLIENVDMDNVPEDDQLQLNPDEIVNSIETIQQTVSQLIQFLFQTFAAINDGGGDNRQTNEIKQMIIASLRLLFVYSKEENEIFQAEIDQLKPFIWKFIDQQQQQNDQEIEQLRHLIMDFNF